LREDKQPAYEIDRCRKEQIMTTTPNSIYISTAHVESVFNNQLEADLLLRYRGSSWHRNGLCPLWQEVLYA
jgi:hypothetical protein